MSNSIFSTQLTVMNLNLKRPRRLSVSLMLLSLGIVLSWCLKGMDPLTLLDGRLLSELLGDDDFNYGENGEDYALAVELAFAFGNSSSNSELLPEEDAAADQQASTASMNVQPFTLEDAINELSVWRSTFSIMIYDPPTDKFIGFYHTRNKMEIPGNRKLWTSMTSFSYILRHLFPERFNPSMPELALAIGSGDFPHVWRSSLPRLDGVAPVLMFGSAFRHTAVYGNMIAMPMPVKSHLDCFSNWVQDDGRRVCKELRASRSDGGDLVFGKEYDLEWDTLIVGTACYFLWPCLFGSHCLMRPTIYSINFLFPHHYTATSCMEGLRLRISQHPRIPWYARTPRHELRCSWQSRRHWGWEENGGRPASHRCCQCIDGRVRHALAPLEVCGVDCRGRASSFTSGRWQRREFALGKHEILHLSQCRGQISHPRLLQVQCVGICWNRCWREHVASRPREVQVSHRSWWWGRDHMDWHHRQARYAWTIISSYDPNQGLFSRFARSLEALHTSIGGLVRFEVQVRLGRESPKRSEEDRRCEYSIHARVGNGRRIRTNVRGRLRQTITRGYRGLCSVIEHIYRYDFMDEH